MTETNVKFGQVGDHQYNVSFNKETVAFYEYDSRS